MSVTPLILGSGRSSQAIAKSLACIHVLRPELGIQPPVLLKRGASLQAERSRHERALLCIANPHGLHAEAILEGSRAGFDAILLRQCGLPSPRHSRAGGSGFPAGRPRIRLGVQGVPRGDQPVRDPRAGLEGYIEITSSLLREICLGEPPFYPKLSETLNVLDAMLQAQWD